MPRFRSTRDTDVVHAPWWDENESAVFQPRFTEAMVQEHAILLEPRQAALKEKLSAVSSDLQKEVTDRLTGICALAVTLQSWTFRTDPTPEQEAAGEPGKIQDLTVDAIADLDAKDIVFLIKEFTERYGRGATASGEFQPPGPVGDPVHKQRVPRGRGANSPRRPEDGDHMQRLPLPAKSVSR